MTRGISPDWARTFFQDQWETIGSLYDAYQTERIEEDIRQAVAKDLGFFPEFEMKTTEAGLAIAPGFPWGPRDEQYAEEVRYHRIYRRREEARIAEARERVRRREDACMAFVRSQPVVEQRRPEPVKEPMKQRPIPPERFKKRLNLSHSVYKPELEGPPLMGWLVREQEMQLDEGTPNRRTWQAFVIETTEPTRAFSKTGEVVDIGVGEEVLIPVGARLLSALSSYAHDRLMMYEVFINPLERVRLGSGYAWTYDVRLSNRARSREPPAFQKPTL